MQKHYGRFSRHRLGFLCLLAGALLAVSSAQSGRQTATAPQAASSPQTVQKPVSQIVPAGGWLPQHSRILPSHAQRVKQALDAMRQRNAIHGQAAGVRPVPFDSTAPTPSPNFGGFIGGVSSFPVAHPVNSDDSSGSPEIVYDVSDVISGDFNGDGKLDAAVIQVDGSVETLLGDGKGGFSAPVVTAGTDQFSFEGNSAVAVDLNGDGKQDIVAYDGYDILVWLSNGDGSFAAPVFPSYQFLSYASNAAFAVADVNGDGYPDILIAGNASSSGAVAIQALLNTGSGTFGTTNIPTTTYTVPSGFTVDVLNNTAKVAQINGKTTLIFAAQEAGEYGPPNTVEIFQAASNGDGTFTFAPAPLDIPSIQGTGLDFGFGINTSLLIADLNGDGAPDILVAPGDGSIYTALGEGGNGFSTPTLAISGYYFSGPTLITTDLDDDGIPDLVDAEFEDVATFRGNGDGTFTPVNAAFAGATGNSSGYTNYLTATAYGDFNGDGRLDYVSVDTNYGAGGFYAGLGGFNFCAAARLVDTGANDQAPASPFQLLVESALDLNGDGKTDLVAFNESVGPGGYSLKAISGINQGGGQFNWINAPSLLNLPISSFGVSQQAADFNHDGKQDLLLYGADGESVEGIGICLNWYVYVAISNGDGTFQQPVQLQLPNQPECPNSLEGFTVADVNGDGNPDIVFTYGNPGYSSMFTGGPPSGYYVALGDGTGNFPTVNFTPYGNSIDLAVLADFDGDGFPDLVLTNFPDGTHPAVSILLNDGTGNFANLPAKPISYTEYPVYMLAGDVNQDGKQDLLIATGGNYDVSTQTLDSTASGILIYPGNGDGTVGTSTLLDQGEGPAIALEDFNGDGLPDILAGLSYDFNTTLPSVSDPYYGASLLLNKGGGNFAPPVNTLVPYGVSFVTAGNFYGDGVADALEVDGDGATLLINQGGSAVVLSASDAAVEQGDSVALTARVIPNLPARPLPTGQITFYDGMTALGTGNIDGTGAANLTTTQLSVGTHTITATYAGDANFNPVAQSSATVAVVVNALPPAFTLAASSSTLSINQSGSSTLTLTLTPNETFTGSVSLAASGLPAGVTAQFSPATAQLTAGQPATVTLTIGEGSASSQSASTGKWMKAGAGISVAGLLLFALPRRRRALRGMLFLAALGLALTVMPLMGCGGGSGSVKTGQTQITITATPSVSGPAVQATTVTLQVQ